MNPASRIEKTVSAFELITVAALQLLMVVLILVSSGMLFVLAFEGMRTRVGQIATVGELLELVQRSIAGILAVVLGLEVLETLRAYFRDHYVRLDVILTVAIIAVSRHLVQVDFEHAPPLTLLALSSVIVSLTVGYFLVKKALFASSPGAAPRQH